MKKCPYCAEEIQDAAVVCKYCHRDLHAEIAAKVTSSFIDEIVRNNSTTKIVTAFFLFALGIAIPAAAEGRSGWAILSGWSLPTIGIFMLLPRRIGNVVLRFGLPLLATFALFVVVKLVQAAFAVAPEN